MEFKSIKVQKLFGLLDYEIDLDNEEFLTILTGPNGYGKTTILNIIYHFFNQKFYFFQKLEFQSISFNFSANRCIELTKKKGKPKTDQIVQLVDNRQEIILQQIQTVDIQVHLLIGGKLSEAFVYNSEAENKLVSQLGKYIQIQRISQDVILDNRTRKHLSLREFLLENGDNLPIRVINLLHKQQNNQISLLLSSVDVYIIREQRLLTQNGSNNRGSFINTIEHYAKELKEYISNTQLRAYQRTQELDSSFPKRLIDCKRKLSREEFDTRFTKLKERQQQLKTFGISTSNQDVTDYNEETANVLTVYLEDSEQKVGVYDELLEKIDLFVNILNEKKFAFKSIVINGPQGFYFQSNNGQPLNLTDLSSGEQQEVVLLYELLFRTNSNTLILIDEPEISLHVIWQKAFIQDLQRIADIKHISFLISTHAPQIINDRWDLTLDLFDLANK
ncbi:AAA family ATPase [Dysgonomonas sp. GY617]|uniref:AAA family ATPase n=1 Tax=Dysgonomonas sp. GY617 TaxID=2780420 RepID=UPI001883CAAD|nr:AAA family ATPase [Dysgonomonas sp. GY617]MBF0578108.1 AAA family ATPase [Dysgonomonas sp. GY617]